MKEENPYRPLPEGLFIEESKSRDKVYLLIGLYIGTRILDWPSMLVRTPLGGFINHSDEPNCMRVQKDNRWNLLTIANILPGEELTLRYTMYKPSPIDLDDYGDHIKKVFKGES